jgi:hypothetical protein
MAAAVATTPPQRRANMWEMWWWYRMGRTLATSHPSLHYNFHQTPTTQPNHSVRPPPHNQDGGWRRPQPHSAMCECMGGMLNVARMPAAVSITHQSHVQPCAKAPKSTTRSGQTQVHQDGGCCRPQPHSAVCEYIVDVVSVVSRAVPLCIAPLINKSVN